MAAPPDDVLPPGARLAHFEVRRRIGGGAMGAVYEAHDTSLDRLVAIKVVHPGLADDEGVAARFVDEPRAAAKVVHDNLAHVYFVGTTEGRPFYAMELVPGTNLEELVEHAGPLPLDRAVDVLVQAAKGLAATHDGGLVHRDVKPSNLLLTPDGRVKVTDFGISKSLRAESGATVADTLVGTPDFMSPEQCRARAVDARSDVYALGLTAFHLLTGRRAWLASSLGDLLDQQMNAPTPSARALRPELPEAVDDVLRAMTAKDPAARVPSMRDVIRLLDGLRPRAVVLAPLLARGFALLLDAIVFGIGAAGIHMLLSVLARFAGLSGLDALIGGSLDLALLVLLQPVMERRYGASVGKLLLRLEVVREDGARPDLPALLRRFLVRIPAAPLFVVPEAWLSERVETWIGLAGLLGFAVGAVVYAVTRGTTLSDRWTRTRVVYAELRDPARFGAGGGLGSRRAP